MSPKTPDKTDQAAPNQAPQNPPTERKTDSETTPVSTPLKRPRRYSLRRAKTICRRLARGQSLTFICADPTMPHYSSVMNWLAAKPDFRQMYSQARPLQAHALADEVLAVLRSDRMPPADKQVRIKGLCWLAAKLHPAKYSEKTPPLAEEESSPSLTVIVQPPGEIIINTEET